MKKIKLLLAAMAAMIAGGLCAQTDAEYAAANAEIQANGVYKIYTLSNGTTTGVTRYYLKTDGYLTDDASSAGQFTFDFQRIFGGFKMGGYRINKFTNGGASDNSFSGDALKKIITTGQNRTDWEAQVFFKNEEGYAVRSTNATGNSWGASAFWNVVEDNDEDGLPNATYTVNDVPYVWQLEQVTAGDWSDVTAKYITNYNPVSNADGWIATNGNRLNQWASNPINFDSSKNLAEMWNNQGASLKQVLNNLPAGYYSLKAIACSRQGQTSTLSAGSFSAHLVETDGSFNNTDGCKTWFNNGNGVNSLDFTVDETSNVEIGITTGTDGDAWTLWRAFYLTYNSEPTALRKALIQAKEAANSAMDDESYSSVTGFERTQLTASVAKTIDETQSPSAVQTAYNNLIDEITEKLADFQAAPQYYTQLEGENNRAALFGIAAQNTESQSALTATDTQAKAVYNYVTTNYNTVIDLGEWTKVNAGEKSNQHWDGTNTTTYNEQLDGWSGSTAWTTSYSQDIELPAGDYVFKVAGRHSQFSTLELIVKKGETVLGSINDFPIGDSGRGIATDGTASFADGATYANGTGRGWQWRYVPFTINEESASITISVSGGNPQEKQYQWLSFCNYTVQSAPSVAASTVAYNQALEAAIAARDDDNYTNVQGTDRGNLVAAIDADKGSTIESIDAAAETLRTTTTTFIAAKTSWDKLVSTRESVSDNLPYANSTKKDNLDAAVNAEVTGDAAAATDQAAVIERMNRLYVESNALAEGVSGAENKTSLITNPNADENADGWSGGFNRLTSEQFTQGDGTLGGGYFDKNGSNSYEATQTIVNLAPGKYLLTVTARAQSGVTDYKVKATNSRNEEFTAPIPVIGNQGGVFGRGFNDASVVLEQNFTGDATIGIVASYSDNFWLSFDRVRLVRIADSDVTLATSGDYDALKDAIDAVKDNVIGFEKDEFAPYYNIDAIGALTEAKEIDPLIENTQASVQEATATLTGATWNVNAEEVNGIYDGFFTNQTVPASNTKPLGWNRCSTTASSTGYEDTGYQTRIVAIPEGVTTSNVGMMTKQHAFYGDQENYTLPLKAETYYTISFKYAGYNDKPTVHINVYSADGTKVANSSSFTSRDNKGHQQSSSWSEYSYTFKTAASGNYVIGFIKDTGATEQKQAVFTDIELKKAAPESVTVTDAGYATYASDNALDFTDSDIKAYIAKANGTTGVTFHQVYKVPANTGVLLYKDGGATEDIPVFDGTGAADVTDNVFVPGEGVGVASVDGTLHNYILNNKEGVVGFYRAAGQTVATNRAYIQIDEATPVKEFISLPGSEDDADGINSLSPALSEGEGAIYNVAGQRLNKMQKGVNIVNGKKVLY